MGALGEEAHAARSQRRARAVFGERLAKAFQARREIHAIAEGRVATSPHSGDA
jgi:hypothetical protein